MTANYQDPLVFSRRKNQHFSNIWKCGKLFDRHCCYKWNVSGHIWRLLTFRLLKLPEICSLEYINYGLSLFIISFWEKTIFPHQIFDFILNLYTVDGQQDIRIQNSQLIEIRGNVRGTVNQSKASDQENCVLAWNG